MENTNAFSYLTDLISVIGNLFTTPFMFGLSILQITMIPVALYFILNILLGGRISPRNTSHEEEE